MLDYPFLLFSSPSKAFPRVVYDESGKAYEIDANFRTVMKILDLYEDRDMMDDFKFGLMLEWFYRDERPGMDEAFQMMFDFIAGHTRKAAEKGAKGKPEYDFGFDADVIYSSVLKEYGVDLIETPFLHWYKFRMMLAGLSGDSAFKQRIQIRVKDLKGLKGKELTAIKAAKETVRIPEKKYAEDETERARFVEEWG